MADLIFDSHSINQGYALISMYPNEIKKEMNKNHDIQRVPPLNISPPVVCPQLEM